MRVLYIHHCGIFGGSSRSLCEFLKLLPAHGVKTCVLTPRGNVAALFRSVGAEVLECGGISQWDNTRYSYYRGLRWLVLLRELSYLPSTVMALIRARRRWPDIDIVHLNEITAVIPAILARKLFNCPVVMHARAVYRTTAESRQTIFVMKILRRAIDRIVAIDETVARSLPRDNRVVVIHNGFGVGDTMGAGQSLDASIEAVFGGPRLRVAMVGNLLAVKGVREFVEAARLCRDRGIDADFMLIGANIRHSSGRRRIVQWLGLNQDSREWVEEYIHRHSLQDRVHLTGPTMNIGEVYKRIDVLCFPSYFDAPGRPVFEAAFFGVPSIVAVTRPTADTFVHEETGLAVPARDAKALADAVQRLHDNPKERVRMGTAARRLAQQNFDSKKNVEKLISLYRSLFLSDAASSELLRGAQ